MSDDYYYYSDSNNEINTVYLCAMILIACLSFYFQAVVTEERLIPALNVIANRLSFSDDVAGATLMAAGASAPELFTIVVCIFFNNSEIGMGTIVGSEIFNQLVICAGSIFAAKNNKLKLDPVVMSRDVGFYFISIVILFWVLSDRRPIEENDGDNIIYVSSFRAGVLLGSYCLYVFICANFKKWFKSTVVETFDDSLSYIKHEDFDFSMPSLNESGNLNNISTEMPFVREPAENFHRILSQDSVDEIPAMSPASSVLTELFSESSDSNSVVTQGEQLTTKTYKKKTSLFLLNRFEPRINEIHGIEDIVMNDRCSQFYLWQQSSFYDKAKIGINAWQLRWFCFSHDRIISLPFRKEIGDDDNDKFMLPMITSLDVDESRLLIKVVTNRRNYVYLAPSDAVFLEATKRFGDFLNILVIETEFSDDHYESQEYHPTLIDYPSGSSHLKKLFYIILLPINLLVHFVILDVRITRYAQFAKAIFAMCFSIIFLIIGSYIMVSSLESFSHQLQIPETVVGVTVSAAGTSVPAYIASQIAARQGLGNMAISNVFGGNTFNICVALGLPWFLYACLNGGYYELPDDRISEFLLEMAIALVIFIIVMICTRFSLRIWHAYLFFALYALYIVHYVTITFLVK